ERETAWRGPSRGVISYPKQTWFVVEWQGEPLEVLVMHWTTGMGDGSIYFILADRQAVAERFVSAVCEWNSEVRAEVLVFEGGGWHKDPELFRAIKGVTLDHLVLRGTLKKDIYDDLAAFFTQQETYDRYSVPWKRGILFIGP